MLELRKEIYEPHAVAQVDKDVETVPQLTADDASRTDVICFFAPKKTNLTMRNIRVTDVDSIIDDQIVNVVGKVYHIEDETYGKGEHQSILFWDHMSFLRTRCSESIEKPSSFLLLLSIKVPLSIPKKTAPITIFSHTVHESNVLSLSYDSTRHNLYIDFLNMELNNESNRHSFGGPIYGDCMISVGATFDEHKQVYTCSFEVVRAKKPGLPEASLKEFDVRIPTVTPIPDDSCMEFGKTTMFLRKLQYHVGEMCEKDRVDCKTNFRKSWDTL